MRVLFNSVARLRKEENLNLTSVLSPELKKKKIALYLIILLHKFGSLIISGSARMHLFRGHLRNSET